MRIELHTPGVKLHRAQSHMLLASVRQAFAQAARSIARVVVRIREDAGARTAPRSCELEVHLLDGRVKRVEERHRRVGALVRRAVQRAWRVVAPAAGIAAPVARQLPALASPRDGR